MSSSSWNSVLNGGQFGQVSPAIVLLALAVVAIVMFLWKKNPTTSSVQSVQQQQSQPVVTPAAYEYMEPVLESAQAVPDQAVKPAEVKAKHSVRDAYFADATDDGFEQPFADGAEGYTYTDFQNALLSVDRAPAASESLKRVNADEVSRMAEHLSGLREMIGKSGKSLEQFMDENMVSLPQSITDMWNASLSAAPADGRDGRASFAGTGAGLAGAEFTHEEAQMLARDSLQVVPLTEGNSAALVLRDILHSRTEAVRIGVELPEMPAEQRKAIEFWRSQRGVAGEIASTIASRFF